MKIKVRFVEIVFNEQSYLP